MPYRITLLKSAIAAVQGATHPSTRDIGPAAATGAGALILALLTEQHLVLLGIVFLLMITMDLVTGVLRAILQDTYWKPTLYGGIIGKLLLVAVVVVAIGLDLTLVTLDRVMEATDFGGLATLWPITTSSLVWLIIAEASSAMMNVRSASGAQAIPAVIIRALDMLKYKGEGPPPRRRHYDKAEIAERNELLRGKPPKVEDEES